MTNNIFFFFFAFLAQLEEQKPSKLLVKGSSPLECVFCLLTKQTPPILSLDLIDS